MRYHEFQLPPAIAELVAAKQAVKSHYDEVLTQLGSDVRLTFTLDGNLVGDIGEALAAELFGVQLVTGKSNEGIDGYAPDGRSVQVKATGTSRGPAFRQTKMRADHLLFFALDFETAKGEVVYNGPEHVVIARLPQTWSNQRAVPLASMRTLDRAVETDARLERSA